MIDKENGKYERSINRPIQLIYGTNFIDDEDFLLINLHNSHIFEEDDFKDCDAGDYISKILEHDLVYALKLDEIKPP